MSLIINNVSNNRVSYLGGTINIDPSSSYTAVGTNIFQLAVDSQLIYDCTNYNATISDGVNLYSYNFATDYLRLIASSLGSQVVKYIGTAAPNFAILVGSKDPNGNIKPFNIDANNNLYVDPQAVYNSSLPAVPNGMRADYQINQFAEATIQFRNQYRNITGNTTVTVKSGSGRLHGVMINKNWTGGTVVIYDNTAGSGTVIATIDFGSPSGGLLSSTGLPSATMIGPLGLEFSTGLTAVTSGSSSNNITILYY